MIVSSVVELTHPTAGCPSNATLAEFTFAPGTANQISLRDESDQSSGSPMTVSGGSTNRGHCAPAHIVALPLIVHDPSCKHSATRFTSGGQFAAAQSSFTFAQLSATTATNGEVALKIFIAARYTLPKPTARSARIVSNFGRPTARSARIVSNFGRPTARSARIASYFGRPTARSARIVSNFGRPTARTARPTAHFARPSAPCSTPPCTLQLVTSVVTLLQSPSPALVTAR
jgi:hypothetical protein